MNTPIIVFGPQGSGKTSIAQALAAQHNGRLLEEWSGQEPLQAGDVATTNICPPPQIDEAIYVEVKHT